MENFITEDLMEKTFLFCWKKISDKEEAQDLAQEIILDAMLILRSGKKIENFYGLFWRIAHNKVVDFYRKKRPVKFSLDDMENSLLGFDKSIGDYIKQEELDTLSKSMAHLAKIHRDILVRFYIKNQSVKEIASALKLPTGTVTSRLSDARRNLKENFETMENRNKKNKKKKQIVDFELEFFGNANQAWIAISSLIDRQILFACREKSQTANQLANLLEIPLLFIEDNIEKLVRANVLFEEKKGKYLTDFSILPKSVIRKAKAIDNEICTKLKITERFFEVLTSMKQDFLKEDFYGNDFDWEYLLPYFIIRSDREFGKQTGGDYLRETYGKGLPDRMWRDFYLTGQYEDEPGKSTKETEELIGPGYNFQIYTIPEYGRIEVHNTINTMHYEKDGHSYSLDLDRLYWLNGSNAGLYLELIKNPKKSLSKKEEVLVADMMNNGVLEKTSKGYKGTIPVISFALVDKWCKIWHEKFKELSIEFYDALYKAEEKIVLPYIRHDLLWASFWHLIPVGDRKSLDSMLMQYAIDNGMVRFAEGKNSSCTAMVLLKE